MSERQDEQTAKSDALLRATEGDRFVNSNHDGRIAELEAENARLRDEHCHDPLCHELVVKENHEMGEKLIDLEEKVRELEQLARLASAFMRTIIEIGSDFFWNEDSEDWCELLAEHGFAEETVYDPAKHGEIDDVEPGDRVWIFSEAMKKAAQRPAPAQTEEGM